MVFQCCILNVLLFPTLNICVMLLKSYLNKDYVGVGMATG